MSTLFPERQATVRVLYKAAGQLLDSAVDTDYSVVRELNRSHAMHCIELAEKIAKMGAVTVIVDRKTPDEGTVEVKGIPFNLGYHVYVEDCPEKTPDDKD